MDRRYFLQYCVSLSVYMLEAQFVTPWTIAHQPPLFIGFPRQEYWREFPFLNPGNLFNTLLTYRINTYADMEAFYNKNFNI